MSTVSKKIILIGNIGVGKTSLIQRFVHQKFSEEYLSTIGVKVDKKMVQINNRLLSMLIWDVAGDASQKNLNPNYLLGSRLGTDQPPAQNF